MSEPPTSPELGRRVYCLSGVAPEVQAYAMARYSRSSQSMLESVRELNSQRAEQFLNTFYFQYGHRSIADLAHLAMAIENVSILAAVRVVDESLWDGQERSTRYQDFRRTRFVVPPELSGHTSEQDFCAVAEGLFERYESLTANLLELLLETVPIPPEMDRAQAERTLRARAFDVTRYLLPLATRTSVGQVVSARVLERQISRLLSDPLAEVQGIGQDLRRAAEEPSATLDGMGHGPPTTPTLVKYTAPLPYLAQVRTLMRDVATEVLAGVPRTSSPTVQLAPRQPLLDELVATLLYAYDPQGRSYRAISDAVADLSEARKSEILQLSVRDRGRHDELLRAHQSGQPLLFDLFMDFGSFRDLHRHRRCVQIIQGPRLEHGFDPVEDIFRLGLGAAGEAATAQQAEFQAALGNCQTSVLNGRAHFADGTEGPSELEQYLYPLAIRTRALFKMDPAEAAYIIEQRTAPAGHFSYRHVAWQMYLELQRREPSLAGMVRATNPNEVVDLLRR